MPTTYNGIGTWYYGKRNLVESPGVCDACHAEGMFQSYDTTLYFVFLLIPLFPLKKLRVLLQCPACQRHRVVPLHEWRGIKEKDIREAVEKLLASPGDEEKARETVSTVASYQDYALFRPVAEIVETKYAECPELLTHLGAARLFLQQYGDAEKTLKKAWQREETDPTRELLAEALIKQGKTDEAAPYLAHIAEREVPDRLGCLVLLARAWQGQGEHEKALRAFDQCVAVAPALASDKALRKLRKLSEKHRHSGKKIKNGVIPKTAAADAPGKKDLAGGAAKAAGPVLLAAILALYLGICFHMRRHQPLYLANGLDRAYAVELNGETHRLPPFGVVRIEKPGGTLTFESRELAIPPTSGDLSINFFLRPFVNATLIVNPDGCAVFSRETAHYADPPKSAPWGERSLLAGRHFYRESGLDYVFEEFPGTLQAEKGSAPTRRRIAALSRDFFVARTLAYWLTLEQDMGGPETLALAKRILGHAPNTLVVLAFLEARLSPEERVAALEPGLDATPVPVDLHRRYQDALEALGRKDEARERYAGKIRTDGASVWKYLYARMTDDRAEKRAVLKEGAEQPDPSPYCFHGLAYDAMRDADFAAALAYGRRAVAADPRNPTFSHFMKDILFAAGHYDEALEHVGNTRIKGHLDLSAAMEEMQLLVRKGQPEEAEQGLNTFFAEGKSHIAPDARAAFDRIEATCRQSFLYSAGRLPEYLAATEFSESPDVRFQRAITQRNLPEAEKAFAALEKPAFRDVLLLLILAGAEDDQEALLRHRDAAAAFLREMPTGEAPLPASVFSDGEPTFSLIAGLDVNEDKKIAAVAVGLLHPGLKKECFALADTLNYRPVFPHLLLKDLVRAP